MSAIVVVPDRQLSLAIGKEGQNTRLAARLTGWRLDIKGMTEWEEIREARLRRKEEEGPVAVEEPEAEAGEPEDTLAVAQEAVEESPDAEAASQDKALVAELETPAADTLTALLDEDQVLEALIRDEEAATQEPSVATAEADAQPVSTLSVEDLQAFTLDDVETIEDGEEDEDGEDEDQEGELPDLPEMPVLTPDAGKIRFAEDLIEDVRGGRRAGRGRRGGGAAARGPRGGRR